VLLKKILNRQRFPFFFNLTVSQSRAGVGVSAKKFLAKRQRFGAIIVSLHVSF
jgi:hypothetical protein